MRMENQLKYHMSEEQISAELELVRMAQNDPNKFEPLYKVYFPRIAAFLYQRLDSKDAAYEIAAQGFFNALSQLHRFKARGLPFGAWLFRIARNELNQCFRKKRLSRTLNIDDKSLGELKQEIADASSTVTSVQDDELSSALLILNEDELELVEMRFFENRAFREICEITGTGESACKMKLYRALEKLKKKLTNHGH